MFLTKFDIELCMGTRVWQMAVRDKWLLPQMAARTCGGRAIWQMTNGSWDIWWPGQIPRIWDIWRLGQMVVDLNGGHYRSLEKAKWLMGRFAVWTNCSYVSCYEKNCKLFLDNYFSKFCNYDATFTKKFSISVKI